MTTARTILTDQQDRAVSARDVSVALSAGAGCGKTFVLTERFLAQLDPQGAGSPARLGQLVAITFTERAAREMRDRIRAACRKRLIEAPDGQVDYWLDLIRELDSARITTIHSFCASLLRSHAVEARLDPQFQVLDQAQADTLLFELLDERLRQRLADRDEDVIRLVVQFGLTRLHEMIQSLLRQRQQLDWQQWLDTTPDELAARWDEHRRYVTLPQVLEDFAELPEMQTVLELAAMGPSSNAKMQQRCDVLLECVPRLPKSNDPAADLTTVAENAKVQGGGSKKDWADEQQYEVFRDAAKAVREKIKKLEPLLSMDPEAMLRAAETALQLVRITADAAEAYAQRKQELAALDFNDLLILARELLVGPERADLRKQLASQIRLLLVDEFQDTDPVQVELVRALCGDELTRGKLFFVGDYKQSIYRFRGADPDVFRQLRQSIPEAGRLPLSLNFRSQPAILNFVNGLFAHAMGQEYEPLRAHRPQISPEPAIEFLWATEDQPGPRNGQDDRLREIEADWIARRIRTMLDSGEPIVWDEEAAAAGTPATRPVRPGDVALLFRALSNVEHYEAALRRWGIDYYLVGGHAFYAQQEIYDVLNLLRALQSPIDEVSLTGVLRSPMFGLWDETIFWLAQHPQGLLAGLLAEEPPDDVPEEQQRQVQFAAATIASLRAIKDRVPVAQLLEEAMTRTGYDAMLLGEFLGARKLANLQKLVEQARSFDRSGIFSLADFITQLSQFVARQPDEALAATHPESSDVVRLMTIHQSKGLEFPVVVVPDLGRRTRGSSGSVAFTPSLGPMVKTPESVGGFELHALAENQQQQAEMIRLLYVATTRAADYLILSAGVPQLGQPKGPWMELLDTRFDLLTGKPKVDLPDEVRVRVTTDEPPVEAEPSSKTARRDIKKVVEKAQQLAESGSGKIPELLAPIGPDPTARRQYSFSRLTGHLHAFGGNGQSDLPAEDSPPVLDPRGLGSLVHAVLEEIDFSGGSDVRALVERHAQRHLPESDATLDEPIAMTEQFLSSDRAKELASAAECHRELEFLLAWPPESPVPGGRYLQGFIDCLYRDEAGWHVLDFKTNRISRSTLDRVAADYEMQMLVYALAVEKILGTSPVELVLHFLREGLEYKFPWNTAARDRVIKTIGQAL